MPFIQRIVEPTHVSRVEVGQGIQNELECVTNHSLANIIRQLSTLSKHAEDMFSELYQETNDFFKRASQLNGRIEHLRMTVMELNPTEEIVSLQDIHLRKPYRSSNQHDQQVVSKTTISRAILETYNRCEKPPALDKLNQYREDGKDCMKFYTDPGYFFELWYKEIQKDIDTKKAELRKKRDKRRPNQAKKPAKIKEVVSAKEKHKAEAMGVEFTVHYQNPKIGPSNPNKPVPAGMVQTNTPGMRPQEQEVPNDARRNISEPTANHIESKGSRHMNGPYTHTNSQYIEQQPQNHTETPGKQYRDSQRQSNAINQRHMSPKDRRSSSNRHTSNSMIANRPSMAPPPPPPLGYEQDFNRQDRTSLSPSPQRESLPPPPPPPMDGSYQNSPQHQTPVMIRNQLPRYDSRGSPAGSPIRQMSEDQDLPPPPPQPISPEMPPPPPPPILPQANVPAPPPPPPPPPLPPAVLPLNTRQQPDTVSVNSDISTSTYSSTGTREIEPPMPEKSTGRSALLDEIRKGDWSNKLRKAEDRKERAAPQDKFDVHAVMTRAFEMRQKVMADSDSDEDEDFDDAWEADT